MVRGAEFGGIAAEPGSIYAHSLPSEYGIVHRSGVPAYILAYPRGVADRSAFRDEVVA